LSTLTRHPVHMLGERPWPLLTSIGGIGVTSGIILAFHQNNWKLIYLGLLTIVRISFTWWRDISRESTNQGFHTKIVESGLKWGMGLFIVSEIFFFVSFFWSFFHVRLSPNIELGAHWPPIGITPFNPWGVPLLNTIILISSGIRVTWCHKSIELNRHRQSVVSLLITILLGGYFTIFQGIEYYEASFSISDSSYGSTFFVATGFHGLHVIVGTSFLLACLLRIVIGILSKSHHLGLKAAIWYWHFVDIVWLFLFFWVYVWGRRDLG